MELDNTFDLLEVLAGQGYPTETVQINLAGDIAYEVYKLENLIANHADDTKEYKALQAKLDEVHSRLAESAFTVHLTAISGEAEDEISKEAKKRYPLPKKIAEYDFAKIAEIEGDQRYYAQTLTIQRSIVKLVRDHDKAVSEGLTLEAIGKFRKNTPQSQWKKITDAMERLEVEARFFETEISEDL